MDNFIFGKITSCFLPLWHAGLPAMSIDGQVGVRACLQKL
jgi:hypothetical protein